MSLRKDFSNLEDISFIPSFNFLRASLPFSKKSLLSNEQVFVIFIFVTKTKFFGYLLSLVSTKLTIVS